MAGTQSIGLDQKTSVFCLSSFNWRHHQGCSIGPAMPTGKMVANWTSAYFRMGLWSTCVQDTTCLTQEDLFFPAMSPPWAPRPWGVAFMASTAQAAAAKAGGQLPIDAWVYSKIAWYTIVMLKMFEVKISQAKAKPRVSTCRKMQFAHFCGHSKGQHVTNAVLSAASGLT